MTISPLLFLHIGAGTLGLLTGAAALLFRKGSFRHRTAGRLFVASMLVMAASASVLAWRIAEWPNVIGGITTLYLIATAWMTIRRKAGDIGRFEIAAFLPALVGVIGNVAFGLMAASSEAGVVDGYPPGFYYFFAGLMGVFAAGDLRLILRGGIAGAPRIARHILRMCYGLFIATGSLFLGQMQVFPEPIRETNILFVLAFLPLLFMIFWMIRVRFKGWNRHVAPQPGAA